MSSIKQKIQQKRFLALGTVIGFKGYLDNLQRVINITNLSAVDKYFLQRDINTMRNRLAILKEVIQRTNKSL